MFHSLEHEVRELKSNRVCKGVGGEEPFNFSATMYGFNENSSNHPCVNNGVRYIFRWQKFNPSRVNEYSNVPGRFCHIVTSNRLGQPDVS